MAPLFGAGVGAAVRAAVERAASLRGTESRRLHCLSVPPGGALPALRLLGTAGLAERSRIVMEIPVGTDLTRAVSLNAGLHAVSAEAQIVRIDHFLRKAPAQNIPASHFADDLFEPIWNRMFIDQVQIAVPETLGLGQRSAFDGRHEDGRGPAHHLHRLPRAARAACSRPGPVSARKARII